MDAQDPRYQWDPLPEVPPETQDQGYHEAGEGSPYTMRSDKGMRMNNPGNLGISPGLGPGAERQYASAEEGVAAIGSQLDRYHSGATTGRPLSTVSDIVSTYSPPNENDTPTLIRRAAAHLGVHPDQELDLTDPHTRRAMVEATLLNEHGGVMPVTREVLNRALPVDPQSMRPVPEPAPVVPATGGHGNVGPYNTKWDAYEGAPRDRDNYRLLQDGNKWLWQMIPPQGDPPGQVNPYYSAATTDKSVNQAVINGPHSWQDPVNRIVGVSGQAFNSGLAAILDIPLFLIDKAVDAISAGTGIKRPDYHYGTIGSNTLNKLGFETESVEPSADDPLAWATTVGRGIGTGLAMALPIEAGGAAAAAGMMRGAPRTAEVMQKMSGIGAGGTGFGAETSMAAGAGIGQQEAHEVYKAQTGREGDIGDVASQLVGGTGWNLARIPLLMAAEKLGVAAFSKAWSGAKEGLYGSAKGGTLDPVTGQQVADATLRHQFAENLDKANTHAAALSTAPPGESAMYLADRATTARQAVNAFAEGSAHDEQALLDQVNTEMPRDITNTKLMYQRMKADYADQGPHVIKDWPSELDRIFKLDEKAVPGEMSSRNVATQMQVPVEQGLSSQLGKGLFQEPGTPATFGALKNIDTLGRAHTVRMDINRLIESEIGSGHINEVRLGVLQRVRNSLAEDLTKGEEGVSPQEIDAYRQLNAFTKARSSLMESPEVQAFMGTKTGDPTAMERLLKQGPEGASAVQILTGVAQQRYGADGLLLAAQDTLRQKYANTVAPHGYVSLGAHNAFMKRYGAILDHPTMENLRDQFNAAAQSETNLNATVGFGKPGGFRNSEGIMERRADIAENYLNSPLNTVFAHLENTSAGDIATRRVIQQLNEDPTGEALKGFAHAVAGRVLTKPGYLQENPGMMAAVDREFPGFAARAQKYTDPATKAGMIKMLGDWALSYVGARGGTALSGGLNMGGGLVMAQRGAGFARTIGEKVRDQATKISSANIVDPAADAAWGRLTNGGWARPFQVAADKMLLHSYVPGLAIGNLPTQAPNTGQPGSPVVPGEEWWTKIGQPQQQAPQPQLPASGDGWWQHVGEHPR